MFVFDGSGDGLYVIGIRDVDLAGNVSAVTTVSITVDTRGPSLTILSDNAQLGIGETATITFAFSEDPGATFTDSDIVVTGGTLGPISGGGVELVVAARLPERKLRRLVSGTTGGEAVVPGALR